MKGKYTIIPGYQHALPAQNIQIAKRLVAKNILQRLPSRPFIDHLPQPGQPISRSNLPRSGKMAARLRLNMLAQPSKLVAS
jgi:hypothetical protein